MGQVVVTIAGRSFRLACEDGDEARLSALAQTFDRTVDELRGSFGEVGDTRLAVMAGLVMTDRLGEAEAKSEQLTAEIELLRADLATVATSKAGVDDQVRQKLDAMAARLEEIERTAPPKTG